MWRTRVEGFSGAYLSPLGGSRISQGADPEVGRVDRMLTVFRWGPDTVGIGMAREISGPGSGQFEVLLLGQRTGEVLSRLESPMLVSGVDAERVYGHVGAPYPRVLVFRR